MRVKISAVMGVFNGAAGLPGTLDSILAQTERDFELIVVDDGSSDETPEILRRYAAEDDRIRVITQQNGGLTRALIAGCAAARGAFIARHDAGDRSLPERLAKQHTLLTGNRDLAFVSSWTELVGPEDESLMTAKGTGRAREPVAILDARERWGVIDGPAHHGSVMFSRDAYERAGGYRAEFYVGQDWDLWYRLAALGKFQMIEEVLYIARLTPNDLSVTAKDQQERIATITRAALDARLRGEDDSAIIARAAAIRPRTKRSRYRRAAGLYFIGEALRRNGDSRAARYFTRAIAASPFYWRAWLRWVQTRLG